MSSVGSLTTNLDLGSPYERHNVAASYTQKSHNRLARGVEEADYSFSSMAFSIFPSNTGLHQPSSALMPTSTTFTHPIYPTNVPTLQPPFYPFMAPLSLPYNDPFSTIEQTLLVDYLPTGRLPSQWDPPQPYAPSPPSINPPTNLQVQPPEAKRERPIQDVPNSSPDRRATSPRYSPYRRQQKKRPAIEFEPDVKKLQDRCKEAGADEQAVLLLEKIFVPEVKLAALTRKLAAKEVASGHFGGESGQAYVGFLRAERDARYTCRLCPRDTEMSWKHRRDVLRHLRRDHFGLAEKCRDWCVSSQ